MRIEELIFDPDQGIRETNLTSSEGIRSNAEGCAGIRRGHLSYFHFYFLNMHISLNISYAYTQF